MFSIFKDKLKSVSENLTTSFQGLKLTEAVSPKSPYKPNVDLNAGAELLLKYQTEWQELHMLAEENALAAQKADARICTLHSEVARQWEEVTRLSSALSTLPTLCARTNEITQQIEGLQNLVMSVEETLLDLAEAVERKQLQERQLESRFQLAIHGEQRLAQLDTLRAKLSEDHRLKVIQYEKEFEKKQKERQETFSKAFEEDLETYKQTGTVPTIRPSLTSGPSLEEVELDDDLAALDQMLEE